MVLRHESIHVVQNNLGHTILPERTLSPLVHHMVSGGEVLLTVTHYHPDDVAAELEARVLQNLPEPAIAYLVLTSALERTSS